MLSALTSIFGGAGAPSSSAGSGASSGDYAGGAASSTTGDFLVGRGSKTAAPTSTATVAIIGGVLIVGFLAWSKTRKR